MCFAFYRMDVSSFGEYVDFFYSCPEIVSYVLWLFLCVFFFRNVCVYILYITFDTFRIYLFVAKQLQRKIGRRVRSASLSYRSHVYTTHHNAI